MKRRYTPPIPCATHGFHVPDSRAFRSGLSYMPAHCFCPDTSSPRTLVNATGRSEMAEAMDALGLLKQRLRYCLVPVLHNLLTAPLSKSGVNAERSGRGYKAGTRLLTAKSGYHDTESLQMSRLPNRRASEHVGPTLRRGWLCLQLGVAPQDGRLLPRRATPIVRWAGLAIDRAETTTGTRGAQ